MQRSNAAKDIRSARAHAQWHQVSDQISQGHLHELLADGNNGSRMEEGEGLRGWVGRG